LYARQDPYKGEDFRTTLRKVCDRRVNKRPTIPPTCPPKFAELMKKCWSPDPYVRPDAKDLDTALLDMSSQDAEHLVDGQPAATLKERKTGDMLYDLFPKHVADQIKAGKKVEPENHDEVTIIFSDIVHFTDISKSLTPLKVSQMLDRLYLAFDRVAGKHGVFKVETIGDAYLGVTNLEKKQMDCHTKNAALFAIDLVKEASQILIDNEDPSKGHINIRVGFHSGAVVSNVIGSLNPRYSLFGDAISVATRMEENSKANRVLCSEDAYKILQEQAPEIIVQKRGKLTIKGKGEIKVYWVGGDILATGDYEEDPFLEGSKRVGFVEDESEVNANDQEMWQPMHEPPQSPKPKSRRSARPQEQAPSTPPKRSSRRSSTTNNQEATHYRRGK
jgi:class 3 adenylate cyclase